jgi:hypothetical protein
MNLRKTKTRWFIRRDFLGWPVGIFSAEYDPYGDYVRGNFMAPKRVTPKRNPGFNFLEEILDYKMCSCGKGDCKVNAELKRIVLEKIQQLFAASQARKLIQK